MRSPSWEDMHNQLSSAGLIVQTSAVEKLEKLQNVLPLIEAANSSGVRLLNGATVDELLAISSTPAESPDETPKSLSQSTLPRPEQDTPHGRSLPPSFLPQTKRSLGPDCLQDSTAQTSHWKQEKLTRRSRFISI